MIDSFSILLAHGLVFLAFWRLLGRSDLDDERTTPSEPAARKGRAEDA